MKSDKENSIYENEGIPDVMDISIQSNLNKISELNLSTYRFGTSKFAERKTARILDGNFHGISKKKSMRGKGKGKYRKFRDWKKSKKRQEGKRSKSFDVSYEPGERFKGGKKGRSVGRKGNRVCSENLEMLLSESLFKKVNKRRLVSNYFSPKLLKSSARLR